ncbi:hypothetical protein TWF718_009032 [Orbilia javanica]|uniref:Uncharacterized protein n=1 Tax=Orbilia javanica TaxID=47235 RepID=A0AAN8RBD5_9PEZI
MSITMIFKLCFTVLNFFAVCRMVASAAIPTNDAGIGGIEVDGSFVRWSGQIMPIVPLKVEGELFPGGPSYTLEGDSLDAIEEQLLQNPLFNLTAFGNTTLEFPDESTSLGLQKRDRQVHFCERKPRDFDGIVPEDIKPAIDKLLRPPWHQAFCYAPAGACSFVACHGEAGIFLCNHRTSAVRTTCGSACGRFALNIFNKMMKDKKQHSLRLPANGEPICRNWHLDSYRYIGWSWGDDANSWEVDVVPYRGKPCSLNTNA